MLDQITCGQRLGRPSLLACLFLLSTLVATLPAQAGPESAQPDAKVTDAKENGKPPSREKDADKGSAEDGAELPLPQRLDLGLDGKTLKMINRGNWARAVKRLEKLTAKPGKKSQSRLKAWLSFAYLFNGQCKKVNEVALSMKPDREAADQAYRLVVAAFDQACKGKNRDAKKTLEKLPRANANDAFVNFALACVAGKNGEAGAAAEYCKRACELDPRFAWGYRTYGYLKLRWLNQPQQAESALEKALALEPDQGEVTDMLIKCRLKRNDYDGAVDAALASIKANSRSADNHYRLSRIYLKQWRLREALSELDKAIKLKNDAPVYYRSKAEIKKQQGDLDDAIACQNKAVALSKDKAFELVQLAQMNEQAGHTEAALKNLEEALEKNPKNLTAHQKLVNLLIKEKRWSQLIAEYKRALKTDEKNPNLHYHLAEAYMAVKDVERAIEQYKTSANLNPRDVKPFRKLGKIYVGRKRYDKAVRAYRKALNAAPTSVQDLVALGYCYAQSDNYMQAEAGFVTALALQQLTGVRDPGEPARQDIIRSLASLLMVEGRYSDAREQFESLYTMTRLSNTGKEDEFLLKQANALASRTKEGVRELLSAFDKLPEKKQGTFSYSLVQSLLKVGQTEKALERLQSVSEEEMREEPGWFVLKARALRLSGKSEEAEKVISQVVQEAKKKGEQEASLLASALLERARLYLQTNRLDEAEASATQALSAYDRMYASYLVLGKVKLAKGMPNEAIKLADTALEKNPYFTDAYVLAGDAHMKLEESRKAATSYKKATEIYPALLRAHRKLLDAYKSLDLSDEAEQESDQIARMEQAQ